jgi:hypothetical protein
MLLTAQQAFERGGLQLDDDVINKTRLEDAKNCRW